MEKCKSWCGNSIFPNLNTIGPKMEITGMTKAGLQYSFNSIVSAAWSALRTA